MSHSVASILQTLLKTCEELLSGLLNAVTVKRRSTREVKETVP